MKLNMKNNISKSYRKNNYRYLPYNIKMITDLTISVDTCNHIIYPGDDILYTISIFNKGPHIAKDVIVYDSFEDRLNVVKYNSIDGFIDKKDNKIIWNIPKINVGQICVAIIIVKTKKDIFNIENSYITNSVSFTCYNKLKLNKNKISSTTTYVSKNKALASENNKDYYISKDIYNFKSSSTLTILEKFKTYQQTTEYTCGPSCALMVLQHFGNFEYNEYQIANMMNTHHKLGTSTDKIVKFFKDIGWEVKSSIIEGKLDGGFTFNNPMDFRDWVITNLKNNIPIIVEWIDWNGHWQVIIGYDTIESDGSGYEGLRDDVIILADPDDTTDHMQDGYYIYSAERFFYMWLDNDKLPTNQKNQQWIIAKPY